MTQETLNSTTVAQQAPRPPVMHSTITPIKLEGALYVVFDLETMGFSKDSHHIIEIATLILSPNGTPLFGHEECRFQSYIKPPNPMPSMISELTGITDSDTQNTPTFAQVAASFFNFIQVMTTNYEVSNVTKIEQIILVAHNGKRFDVPFLQKSMKRYNVTDLWLSCQYQIAFH